VLTKIPAPRNEPVPAGRPKLAADPEVIAAAADDFGHLIHHVPAAVARPRTGGEVAEVIRAAAADGLAVRARGAGHSVHGQGQCEGGIVCDLTGLDRVGTIGREQVTAGAGTRWSTLLTACLAYGLTPPVLTDYLELTVGGTLSAGGIGGASHQYGPQVDHVHQLQVVTTAGKTITCSAQSHPRVFDSALAAQGQGGIITEATIPLVPAPRQARVFTIHLPSLATLVACQRKLARESRFGYLEGQVTIGESGQWDYVLELACFHQGRPPRDTALLEGLYHDRVQVDAEDVDYVTFCNRMAPGVRLLAATGDWYRPHPWLSVFLPGNQVQRYVSTALASLTPENLGPLPMLLYPLRRGTHPASRLATPPADQDGLFWSFSILRSVDGTSAAINAALAGNQVLASAAVEAGGTVYRISAVP
jgi:cytokinin dehydrogenase